MAKMVKCEMCGARARQVVTKEFDGKNLNFCCRGCLDIYKLLRAEGLVQTEAEEKYFTTTHVEKNPLKKASPGNTGYTG